MVDCYTTFDETCGDTTGQYSIAAGLPATPVLGSPGNPSPSAPSNDPNILNWISTLGGIGNSFYQSATNPPVRGIGIPGSAGALRPATPAGAVGTGTILAVLVVGLLVWLGIRGGRAR